MIAEGLTNACQQLPATINCHYYYDDDDGLLLHYKSYYCQYMNNIPNISLAVLRLLLIFQFGSQAAKAQPVDA